MSELAWVDGNKGVDYKKNKKNLKFHDNRTIKSLRIGSKVWSIPKIKEQKLEIMEMYLEAR